jgi:hypothetical protein
MKLFLPMIAAITFLSSVVTAQPPKEVPELDALNKSWLAEREKALRPIDAKHLIALKSLKDRLTKSGDLHGALAVDGKTKEVGLLLMEWTKLSSLRPEESKVGHGEFLRGNISEQLDMDGSPLAIQGLPVEDGLYAHAPSRLVFNLKGKDYKAIRGSVALADRHVDGYNGSVKFRIVGDGKEIWESATIGPEKGSHPTAKYALNIDGISELELVVDDLGYYGYDTGVWIAPELGKMP